MNNTIILSTVVALLIGGIGGYTLGRVDKHHLDEYSDGHGHMDMRNSDSSKNTKGGEPSTGMMDHSMHGDMMVQSEQAFIEGMIPHHEEAIATAKEVLERGATTPEIRALAEGIITAQTKEVSDMKAWYQSWYNKPYTPGATYSPMMRELKDLSGANLDKVFLEDMIKHHMGAIMMARSVETHIEHEEMRTLTENIVESQSQEIARMQGLLTTIK